MTKQTPVIQSFLVTVEREKPIPELCDKIASRAWGIDGVNTMSARGAVTAIEVQAAPFDAEADSRRFVNGLLGSGMWQLDPRREIESRKYLQHMLENFLSTHGGAPVKTRLDAAKDSLAERGMRLGGATFVEGSTQEQREASLAAGIEQYVAGNVTPLYPCGSSVYTGAQLAEMVQSLEKCLHDVAAVARSIPTA